MNNWRIILDYNIKNLKPFDQRTEKEQRDIRVMGGIASGEARRRKKTMREVLDYLLSQPTKVKDGSTIDTVEAMMTAQLRKALSGDLKATTFIRDTIGEKPVEKQEIVATVSPKMAKEFEDLVSGLDNK